MAHVAIITELVVGGGGGYQKDSMAEGKLCTCLKMLSLKKILIWFHFPVFFSLSIHKQHPPIHLGMPATVHF